MLKGNFEHFCFESQVWENSEKVTVISTGATFVAKRKSCKAEKSRRQWLPKDHIL